jgi:sialate O-acetylesterase
MLAAAYLAAAGLLHADVQCAGIFGDHMVLQRDHGVPVWGTGTPGEAVEVDFAGQSVSTRVDPAGSWSVHLGPMPASDSPRDFNVKGTNTVHFSDVLVGDVWLCSGQSNMEKPIGPQYNQRPTDDYVNAIRQASHPLIRLYKVPHFGKPDPTHVALSWHPCDPESIVHTRFSAVGYYFGREIQEALGVPVGLIDSTYGGTQIEEWMPPGSFAGYPDLAALAAGPPFPELATKNAVSSLYLSMVKPMAPFALRGFLWYQGEGNLLEAQVDDYTDKMRAMVAAWRAAWNGPDLPFYYVQIAPFLYSGVTTHNRHLTPEALPEFWQAQARALSIPHSDMVVTTDLAGNVADIHPTNKLEVGRRLAGLALSETYGRAGAFAHSPAFDSMKVLPSGALELTFRDTDGFLGSSNGRPLSEFTIAGSDGRFFPAEVMIVGDKLDLRSASVSQPVAARFAWREDANPNLINAAGLPAMPFRTDSWPVAVEQPAAEAPPNSPDFRPSWGAEKGGFPL